MRHNANRVDLRQREEVGHLTQLDKLIDGRAARYQGDLGATLIQGDQTIQRKLGQQGGGQQPGTQIELRCRTVVVDCDAGTDAASCGSVGNPPCRTIEYAWNTSHEDLSARGANMLYTLGAAGSGFSPFGNDHGTAVAGVIVADSDSPGIRGIAPAAG